ncbi:EF hand EF hand domain [Trypanosoma vivax]|uniref:EF-hand domain-containing protein n=1 Tax=Trypanosoma vivax (strain Y486) TaxID=1055687 RepID=G0U5J3_TRYVY|nr:hypothetical protein TRVL_06016 [Trypanosoma vivax]KAH8614544.1 EF hand EF hand domain [Trypanosoma vivax]CCC51144.1 conserved hypothetical protein [Trypanosoma vivax Y486]
MSLSEAQRELLSLQFLILDKNSDGRITSDQLGPLLRCWGFCPTDTEVRAAVNLLDPEGTGFISKQQALEMAESMKQQKQQTTEVHVREALQVLDTDGDGFLSTSELRHILMNLGVRLSTEETDEIIADAYVDEQQQINTDDFAKLLFSNLYNGKKDMFE